MGLPVARIGIDLCSGHPAGPTYFPPRPAVVGSPTVFADGIPVVRAGIDLWAMHTNLINVHPGMGVAGSPTVFVEGMPLMRLTDPINCGSIVAMGSPTVFCG
jgi:uncharacterized Zn-binding protein involved in type VI secretion